MAASPPVLAFRLLGPTLKPLEQFHLLIVLVGLVAVDVFAGVPIAFSCALATSAYFACTTTTPLLVVAGRLDEGMSPLILLAVPLFVVLGALAEMAGLARAMGLVSGVSGSKIADMAAVAPVLFPEMKTRGAEPGDLVALLSATGVSIAGLFTGGMVPALLPGACLRFVICRRYRHEDLSHVRRPFWLQVGPLALSFAQAAGVQEVHDEMGIGLFAPPSGVDCSGARAAGVLRQQPPPSVDVRVAPAAFPQRPP